MMMPKMPERKPTDGAVSVERIFGNDPVADLALAVVTDGTEQRITMSEHNAWRAFGMLAVMLGIPLPKDIGKAIKF